MFLGFGGFEVKFPNANQAQSELMLSSLVSSLLLYLPCLKLCQEKAEWKLTRVWSVSINVIKSPVCSSEIYKNRVILHSAGAWKLWAEAEASTGASWCRRGIKKGDWDRVKYWKIPPSLVTTKVLGRKDSVGEENQSMHVSSSLPAAAAFNDW